MPELHNELRIRLLEHIVFIKVLPIVIQMAARVPILNHFQRASGRRPCSDDYHPPKVTAEAL